VQLIRPQTMLSDLPVPNIEIIHDKRQHDNSLLRSLTMPYILYIIYNTTILTIEYITTTIQYYITILIHSRENILYILYLPKSIYNYLRVLYIYNKYNIYNYI